MNFLCPNCNSVNYLSKHSLGKNFTTGVYSDVKYEIQCSECFIDIPSNLCENIKNDKINYVRKIWLKKYKPIHIKNAANCSKCLRKYWEIEKYLFENKISAKDIFYQTYNSEKIIGNLICKICDPEAFK